MLKRMSIFALLIFNLISVVAISQNDEKTALWEVSGNGLEKSSYIYGIINFLPKKNFHIPREVKHSLKKCDVFATKLLSNNSTKNKFNKAIRIPNDGWINDYLTEDELNRLRLLLLLDFEVKENAYYDFYSRLQPMILVPTTTALYLEDDIVYMEDELLKIAKKNRMDLDALGTVEEEIEAFEKFPIAEQMEALKYTLNNFYEHIEDYYQLVKYYVEDQDLEKVKNETFKGSNESQKFRKIYYDDRLTNWFPGVKKMIANQSTFIAIGAPYLVGEQGLIKMLRNDGYTVKPIITTRH